jgi:hypothetical protein
MRTMRIYLRLWRPRLRTEAHEDIQSEGWKSEKWDTADPTGFTATLSCASAALKSGPGV